MSVLQHQKGMNGVDLVEHLNKVFKSLILHYPDQALEKFEEVSYLIKQDENLSKYLNVEDIRNY